LSRDVRNIGTRRVCREAVRNSGTTIRVSRRGIVECAALIPFNRERVKDSCNSTCRFCRLLCYRLSRCILSEYEAECTWLLYYARFLSLSLSLSRGMQQGSEIFAASFLAWPSQRCSFERFVAAFLGMRPVDIQRAATSSSKQNRTPDACSIKAAIEPTRAIKRDSRRSSSDEARSPGCRKFSRRDAKRTRLVQPVRFERERGARVTYLHIGTYTYGRSVVSFASRCTEAVVKRP